MLEALVAAAHLLAAELGTKRAEAGPASTLTWPSGAKDGIACLAELRRNPTDVTHFHVSAGDFPALVNAAAKWVVGYSNSTPSPLVLLSFALLPAAAKGQFARCAAGDFDGYWTQIATGLGRVDNGHNLIIEPGWEADIGSGPHPWGVDDRSQLDDYKACWRRVAGIFHANRPTAAIAWTNSKIYRKNYSADEMNPGDDLIDVYGLMYYDNYLPLNSQPTWDKYVNSHNSAGGGPSGIGSWLDYAKAHGKKLGVSEWGIWDKDKVTAAQADDPVYIHDMAEFFKAHAPDVAYEAYQNNGVRETDDHRLCPGTAFPKAAARYGVDFAVPDSVPFP